MALAAPIPATSHIADLDRWEPIQDAFVHLIPDGPRQTLILRTANPFPAIDTDEEDEL